MLDPGYVRDHPAEVQTRLGSRGADLTAVLAELAGLEADRRALIPVVERLKQEQNAASDAIGRAKREGQDVSSLFAENKARGAEIKKHEATLAEVEGRRDGVLLTLPNLPHTSVPVGRSSDDNPEVRRWGQPKAFTFEPKPHWELG